MRAHHGKRLLVLGGDVVASGDRVIVLMTSSGDQVPHSPQITVPHHHRP